MSRVGLVLGAGGLVGQAYHAGVLAALAEATGWDPRTAEIVVGTSAGSLTGAALRLGVPAHDLLAAARDEPLSIEGGFLERFSGERPDLPPFDPRSLLRPWRLPSRHLIRRTARRPWAFRPAVAAATLLPPGAVDITGPAVALAPALGEDWPDRLWICAARRADGHRVVFGRPGSPPAPLGLAVAASCSIPGYFAPVRIDGTAYLDGGVHSPTNADVLRHEDLDVVVVSSPMSAAHGRAPTPGAGLRWSTHRRLEREVGRLRARGTTVLRIEPDRPTLAVMGLDAMADDRSAEVAEAAEAMTERLLARRAAAVARLTATGRADQPPSSASS